jgi:type I restriction enzyme, R subunit
VQNGYETYIRGAEFTDAQVERLRRIKDVFLAALQERGEIDVHSVFGDPIYENIIGSYDEVNRLFVGRLDEVVAAMQQNFHIPQLTKGAA